MEHKLFFDSLDVVIQFLTSLLIGLLHGFETFRNLCVALHGFFSKILILRIISHILGDFHGAEFRSTHLTEVR